MSVLIGFTKVMDFIQTKIAYVFKWGLVAFMSLIVFEVTMRYLFRAPTIWGLDFRQQIYAALIMLGCSYTLMVKGHVIVDSFTMLASRKNQRLIAIFMWAFIFMPTMLVLTYTMFNLAVLSLRTAEGSGSPWNPPVYPLKTLLTLAYANLTLQGVAEMFKEIISYVKEVKIG
jgi:TRAP-type mannitol/chloroaromatic compound transport system permease small subunit